MTAFSVAEIEFYLEQKYSSEWPRYVQRVPHVLIPGLL